jgi:hypothetical protein
VALGGEAASRDDTCIVEAPISCGKNEMIPGIAHCPVAGSHCSKKSHGSDSKTPTCTR